MSAQGNASIYTSEFVQRLGQDDRVRFFFLDLKVPEDRPDLVLPLFQHAVQALQH